MSSELQLLCFAIDNLETQLSMAKQQRDVVLRRIQDEQFTADSIQCAEYWIQNRHAQYSKANLRDSLRNLSMCKCCDRHQLNSASSRLNQHDDFTLPHGGGMLTCHTHGVSRITTETSLKVTKPRECKTK